MKLYYATWGEDAEAILARGFEDRSPEEGGEPEEWSPPFGVLVHGSPEGIGAQSWEVLEISVHEGAEALEVCRRSRDHHDSYWVPAELLNRGTVALLGPLPSRGKAELQ